ncbi:MAG TPA: stage III sporulation protein AD [Firmicutes bacterium]|nr:stage III sporulation protein AD [Bacillota bacterium]
MITHITDVFLRFNIEQQYVSSVIQLIGIVYYSEFVTAVLKQAGLSDLDKVVEIVVKLYLILYSLPLIVTLFELILSIL